MKVINRQQRLVRLWAPLFAGLTIAFSAAVDVRAAAPAADETGFTPLLQGDKREGWVGYGKKEWPAGWELADGVLHRKSGGGDLRTSGEYGSFDLRFDWKVAPGGNSGVMYRVSEEKGPAYETGPEYQVLDNAKHKDGKSPLTSSASLYALYAPAKDVMKPAGEWNEGRILIQGNRVQHFLNGEKVVDVEIGAPDWIKRVAESKFASWPKFGKNSRGHIALQDHGDEVWFRNVRIKDLDAKTAAK